MIQRHGSYSWVILLLLITSLLFTLRASGAATNYYVDAVTGLDTNAGTNGAAWKTVDRVNRPGDYTPVVAFAPGDTIFFKRGQTWYESLTPPASGNPANPITFKADSNAGALPIIHGAQVDEAYLVFDSLSLSVNASVANNMTISAGNIVVQNCVVTGAQVGIHLWGSAAGSKMYSNQIFGKSAGIIAENPGNEIIGNTLASASDNGITCTADNNTISANICYNTYAGMYIISNGNIVSANSCYACSTGLYFDFGGHNQVLGNEAYQCYYGISVGDSGGSDNFVFGNKVHDNTGSGLEHTNSLCRNNLFYYNLIYNNNWGLACNDSPSGIIFENNVFYHNQDGVNLLYSTATGYIFRNNIFSQNTDSDIVYNGVLGDHRNNAYYHPAGTPSIQYNAATYTSANIMLFEPTAISANPLFVNAALNNFHLQLASPVIDQGTTITAYSLDFEGNKVWLGAAPEIGAFEYPYTPHMKSLSWNNLAGRTVFTNTQNNIVGQIQCSAYDHDTLLSMTVVNLGTAQAASDLSALRLLYSATGNSLTAATIGTFSVVDNKTWTLTGLACQAADQGTFFLAADIAADAQTPRTCRFSLPANQARFQVWGTLPTTAISNSDDLVTTNLYVILVMPEIAVDLAPAAATRAVKGALHFPLGIVTLANISDHAVSLHSLQFAVQAPDGRTLAPGNIFSSVQLRDSSTVLASVSAPFPESMVLALASPIALAPQGQVSLQLQADIPATASEKQFRLGLLDNHCVNNGSNLSQPVSGKAFPMYTSVFSIRDPQLASTFSNFPNPFTPSQGPTKIGYYLPGEATVKLSLWTLDHRLVKTVEDTHHTSGMVEITWDGKNGEGYAVRSGVYLLTLDCSYATGGHEALTRKIAVAR